jgi:ABC-type Mn2+/Zn2+ transport system ATPase subunit
VTPAIEATDLVIGYGTDRVVEGINLIVRPGEALALIGTNGSGKSTLLKTLLGLIPPLSGSLRVMGSVPGSQPQRVSYLRQTHGTRSVIPLRVIDVVRMGRFASLGLLGRTSERDRQLVETAMDVMEVRHLGDAPLYSLSGGQQQRVYLAQMLAHDAQLLVLDEPTSGLDLTGHDRYRTLLRAQRDRGVAVVTATHDIAEAAVCDQVLLLNRRIIAQGSPADVLDAENLLRTFGITLQRLGHELDGHFVIGEAHDHGSRRHER